MALLQVRAHHFRRCVLAAALAVVAAWPVEARTRGADASEQWWSLSKQAMAAFDAHDHLKSMRFAEKALSAARKAFGNRHPSTLSTLNLLAVIYSAEGRYDDAEKLLRETLEGRREVLGPRHKDTLASLDYLAGFYLEQRRYDEAVPLLREALDAKRVVPGPPDRDTLTSLNDLAVLLLEQRRYSEAEPMLQEALKGRREVLGPRHEDTRATLSYLAELYINQRRYDEAAPPLQEVLEWLREKLGTRDPKVLVIMDGLAGIYYHQNRYDEAEALYRDALEARRGALGPRHPDTLTNLNNLAVLSHDQRRYGEAEALYRKTLEGRREVLGSRHPDTLASINGLAEVYRDQVRYGEAEPLYQEALQGRREVLGELHADTLTSLSNLGALRRDQGRFGEAELLFRDVLQGRRKVLGPRDPATLRSLDTLATLYILQHRYSDAEPLLKEALQGRREVLGPRHPETLGNLHNLAALYRDQGRLSEAEPLYVETLEGMREVHGPFHPDTLANLNGLADFFYAQGRNDVAEPLYMAVLAGSERLGPRHLGTLISKSSLAVVLDAQGRYSEAEPLHREALQGMREALGPHHPETLAAQLSLATNLVNLGRSTEAVDLLQQTETDLLGWIGQELYSTEAGAVRRQMVSSQATFQDVVLSLATAADSSDARRLAATVMLRFKVLQGEEEAYLARLARRSPDLRVQTLVSDIGRLHKTLAEAAQGASDAFEKTLQALEGKRRELIDASPEYKNRLQVLNASPDEIRKALPADAVLIEFRQFREGDFRTARLGELRLAGLLLTGAGEPVIADLGPASELQLLATALDDEAAAKLYERLFAPFREALASATAVYVAPDGFLNLVPFARLKLADGSYWAQQKEVHLLQTGRDLLRPDASEPARGLLALGGIDFDAGASGKDTDAADAPPQSSVFTAVGSDRSAAASRATDTFRRPFPALPATANEVKDVAEWYRLARDNEPVETWSGAGASKARLMALKAPPRVLHLATHGFYRPNGSREPMLLSGIALAGANRELAGTGLDGLLFALEAEGLNLDGTELVVLSACDTAEGQSDYSEGVFGLVRALRTAGARNVLVTLWDLKEGEAHNFMVDFYENWLGQTHSDPAKALLKTQRSWMEKSDNRRRDPRAWAPYVVIE
jgi:CHAT domain-containing protein/Tfp pilus assembly protein PilF